MLKPRRNVRLRFRGNFILLLLRNGWICPRWVLSATLDLGRIWRWLVLAMAAIGVYAYPARCDGAILAAADKRGRIRRFPVLPGKLNRTNGGI